MSSARRIEPRIGRDRWARADFPCEGRPRSAMHSCNLRAAVQAATLFASPLEEEAGSPEASRGNDRNSGPAHFKPSPCATGNFDVMTRKARAQAPPPPARGGKEYVET